MNTHLVDFAFCPCGEQTAIQPTKPVISDTHPQPYESVEGSIVVACTRCKRVYRFDTGYMLSLPTREGLAPYAPDAPTRVFRVPIQCAVEGCLTPAVIHVTLNSNTTAEQLQAVIDAWWWDILRCPSGDAIPPRTIRLEPILSLKCPNADCDASFDYPRDWFRVGKSIECVFCSNRFILTTEMLDKLG
jgi:uncharacterized Zn-finger protein